jgi:hypothetical protein
MTGKNNTTEALVLHGPKDLRLVSFRNLVILLLPMYFHLSIQLRCSRLLFRTINHNLVRHIRTNLLAGNQNIT